MIIELNPEHPQPRKVDRIVETLRAGGLIAYPTDSVYGIGCDIFNKGAVDKLRDLLKHIKGEDDRSPLSFICKDLGNIAEYAYVNDYAYRTLRRMLPGPYTFILEATKLVPKVMRNRRKTVGIRVPDAAIPLEIVRILGNPIVTSTAKDTDGDLIPDPWSIQDLYGHAIDIVVDGGYLFPEPSTVVDFTEDVPRLVRQGKGSVEDLEFYEEV